MGKNASKRRRAKLEARMEAKAFPTARLSYLRMSAQKVRLVADLVRGKSVEEAVTMLDFLEKAAAKPMAKLLRSAYANGEDEGVADLDEMIVKTIQVDEGPTAKRFIPRAQGRATRIEKKTSHVKVVLGRRA